MNSNELEKYLRNRTLVELEAHPLRQQLTEEQIGQVALYLAKDDSLLKEGFFGTIGALLGGGMSETKRFLAKRVVSFLGIPTNHPLSQPLTDFITRLPTRDIYGMYRGDTRMRKKLVKVLSKATVDAFKREMPSIMGLKGGSLGGPITDAMVGVVSTKEFKQSVRKSFEDALINLPSSDAGDMEAMQQEIENLNRRVADAEQALKQQATTSTEPGKRKTPTGVDDPLKAADPTAAVESDKLAAQAIINDPEATEKSEDFVRDELDVRYSPEVVDGIITRRRLQGVPPEGTGVTPDDPEVTGKVPADEVPADEVPADEVPAELTTEQKLKEMTDFVKKFTPGGGLGVVKDPSAEGVKKGWVSWVKNFQKYSKAQWTSYDKGVRKKEPGYSREMIGQFKRPDGIAKLYSIYTAAQSDEEKIEALYTAGFIKPAGYEAIQANRGGDPVSDLEVAKATGEAEEVAGTAAAIVADPSVDSETKESAKQDLEDAIERVPQDGELPPPEEETSSVEELSNDKPPSDIYSAPTMGLTQEPGQTGDQVADAIINALTSAGPNGATISDIARKTKSSSTIIRRVLDSLDDVELVKGRYKIKGEVEPEEVAPEEVAPEKVAPEEDSQEYSQTLKEIIDNSMDPKEFANKFYTAKYHTQGDKKGEFKGYSFNKKLFEKEVVQLRSNAKIPIQTYIETLYGLEKYFRLIGAHESPYLPVKKQQLPDNAANKAKLIDKIENLLNKSIKKVGQFLSKGKKSIKTAIVDLKESNITLTLEDDSMVVIRDVDLSGLEQPKFKSIGEYPGGFTSANADWVERKFSLEKGFVPGKTWGVSKKTKNKTTYGEISDKSVAGGLPPDLQKETLSFLSKLPIPDVTKSILDFSGEKGVFETFSFEKAEATPGVPEVPPEEVDDSSVSPEGEQLPDEEVVSRRNSDSDEEVYGDELNDRLWFLKQQIEEFQRQAYKNPTHLENQVREAEEHDKATKDTEADLKRTASNLERTRSGELVSGDKGFVVPEQMANVVRRVKNLQDDLKSKVENREEVLKDGEAAKAVLAKLDGLKKEVEESFKKGSPLTEKEIRARLAKATAATGTVRKQPKSTSTRLTVTKIKAAATALDPKRFPKSSKSPMSDEDRSFLKKMYEKYKGKPDNRKTTGDLDSDIGDYLEDDEVDFADPDSMDFEGGDSGHDQTGLGDSDYGDSGYEDETPEESGDEVLTKKQIKNHINKRADDEGVSDGMRNDALEDLSDASLTMSLLNRELDDIFGAGEDSGIDVQSQVPTEIPEVPTEIPEVPVTKRRKANKGGKSISNKEIQKEIEERAGKILAKGGRSLATSFEEQAKYDIEQYNDRLKKEKEEANKKAKANDPDARSIKQRPKSRAEVIEILDSLYDQTITRAEKSEKESQAESVFEGTLKAIQLVSEGDKLFLRTATSPGYEKIATIIPISTNSELYRRVTELISKNSSEETITGLLNFDSDKKGLKSEVVEQINRYYTGLRDGFSEEQTAELKALGIDSSTLSVPIVKDEKDPNYGQPNPKKFINTKNFSVVSAHGLSDVQVTDEQKSEYEELKAQYEDLATQPKRQDGVRRRLVQLTGKAIPADKDKYRQAIAELDKIYGIKDESLEEVFKVSRDLLRRLL